MYLYFSQLNVTSAVVTASYQQKNVFRNFV